MITGPASTSWILAAPLVTGAVMTPIAGKLSDTYGKKKVLLIILGIFILGLIIGALSNVTTLDMLLHCYC
jgi:MFS family permease